MTIKSKYFERIWMIIENTPPLIADTKPHESNIKRLSHVDYSNT